VKGDGQDATLALGRVEAFFSVAQGLGSLVMGYILDRFGVKTGLTVNFLACAMQYYILSITSSLEMLYLSKVPGMMMGGFLCAQTAIAKVTAEGSERIQALGRLTSSYTVGGFFGPFLGGVLGSSGDYFLGAKLATAGSLIAVGLVMLLPADLDSVAPAKNDSKAGKVDGNQQESWFRQAALVLSLAGPLLMTKVVTGIANNMARSVQSVILKNDLGFDEAMMGSMMSGQFAFGGIANAFLLAPLAKLLGEKMEAVVWNCAVIMGSMYIVEAMLFLPNSLPLNLGSGLVGGIYIAIALFLAVFQYSLATSITAKTQSIVPKTLLGTLMGIEHAIFAIAGMLGPLAGTTLFNTFGLSGLCLSCGLLFFAAVVASKKATKLC